VSSVNIFYITFDNYNFIIIKIVLVYNSENNQKNNNKKKGFFLDMKLFNILNQKIAIDRKMNIFYLNLII